VIFRMRALHAYSLVAAGGALGAMARLFVGDLVARRFGTDFPNGTLAINLSGCFAIALFLTAAMARPGLHPGWRYLFPIGFVGAYTTFSTFAYETQRLLELGAYMRASIYVVLSNLGGLVAVLAGAWLGRKL
jgi:CrcB protein